MRDELGREPTRDERNTAYLASHAGWWRALRRTFGWQVYFGVSSASEAVLAAAAAGAEVLVEPEFAEDAGTVVATLKDPQGGVFSVVEIEPSP